MQTFDLYQDIARRTGGDIYIGVVGPVRAGKSTLIAKVMHELVLPLIKDKNVKKRALDELPQSADGKTIMTTQPKFVPAEAVNVSLEEKINFRIRMVDCVGYVVEGSSGAMEDDKPRLVKTPWSDDEMPFEEAAEFGTKRVIDEHSTIGIVVTTDGSIGTELPRAAYAKSEERVIRDMQATGKPFVILLNTTAPESEVSVKLASSLSEKYGTAVKAVDIASMKRADVDSMLESVMLEFPVTGIDFDMPKWMRTLDADHPIIASVRTLATDIAAQTVKMRDYVKGEGRGEDENIMPLALNEVRLGEGRIFYGVMPKENLFWKVLSAECGADVESDYMLMAHMKRLVHAKREYDRLASALEECDRTGYGLVPPAEKDLELQEPELVKQGARFGIRLRAKAPSLHIMKVNIDTEVSPIVGTEQQSEDLIKFLNERFAENPAEIWKTQMFGKTLHELVKEDMDSKLHALPVDTQEKMRKTLSRILNEGKGGVICILI